MPVEHLQKRKWQIEDLDGHQLAAIGADAEHLFPQDFPRSERPARRVSRAKCQRRPPAPIDARQEFTIRATVILEIPALLA